MYVNWALSDFDIEETTYDSMGVSELDNLLDQQINLNHTTDRCQLEISKNVLLCSKAPIKKFSSNKHHTAKISKKKRPKRVSFIDLSTNELR
jgi:hypothetical protein